MEPVFLNDATLRITCQLRICISCRSLLPGRQGSRDHRSPEWAVIPVAAGRPAQTLPSEQTRLP